MRKHRVEVKASGIPQKAENKQSALQNRWDIKVNGWIHWNITRFLRILLYKSVCQSKHCNWDQLFKNILEWISSYPSLFFCKYSLITNIKCMNVLKAELKINIKLRGTMWTLLLQIKGNVHGFNSVMYRQYAPFPRESSEFIQFKN